MAMHVKKQVFSKTERLCYGKNKARSNAKSVIEDVVDVRATLFRVEFIRLLSNIHPAKLHEEPTESQLRHASRFMYNFVNDSDALYRTSRKIALRYLEALESKMGIHCRYMQEFKDCTHVDSLLRIFKHFDEAYADGQGAISQRSHEAKRYHRFKVAVVDLEDLTGRYFDSGSPTTLSADQFVTHIFRRTTAGTNVAYQQKLLQELGYALPFGLEEQVQRGAVLKEEYISLSHSCDREQSTLSSNVHFPHYVQLASFLGGTPLATLKNVNEEFLYNKFSNPQARSNPPTALSNRPIALSCLFVMSSSILKKLDRPGVAQALQSKLHPTITGLVCATWFGARTPWHQELIHKLSAHVAQTHASKTHFSNELCASMMARNIELLMFMTTYAEEKHNDCLRDFIDTCTVEKMADCAVQSLAQMETHNERLKNAQQCHHAKTKARSWLVLFRAIATIFPQCAQLSTVKAGDLLGVVPNRRVVPEEQARRAFSNDEVEAMLAVVRNDAQLGLLVTILREVALRLGALRHLTYDRLVDELHFPRHVVTVPEKKLSWRCFVTSPTLKRAIKRYSEGIRESLPQQGKAYIFHDKQGFDRPCSLTWIPYVLKQISQEAGVVDVTVHPHAFRHTLVCELIKAGNSMEATSKYMGHKNMNVTATSYYVPTALELHEQIKNPFDGTLQTELAEESDLKDKVQSLQSRLDKLAHFVHHQQSVFKIAAADELSAQEALTMFYHLTPNAEEILRHLLMSSTLSSSSESAR